MESLLNIAQRAPGKIHDKNPTGKSTSEGFSTKCLDIFLMESLQKFQTQLFQESRRHPWRNYQWNLRKNRVISKYIIVEISEVFSEENFT